MEVEEMTLQELLVLKAKQKKPIIVCLCGSTRFGETFKAARYIETLDNRIVLTIGCEWHSDEGLGLSEGMKQMLDLQHLWKIDMADEILVLNCDDYIGESTEREIRYAAVMDKRIRWLEPPSAEHAALAKLVVCIECGSRFLAPNSNKCRSCADGL